MRRPFLFSVIFSLTLCGSLRASAEDAYHQASTTDLSWRVLAEDEKAFVDRMAASFFEDSLRLSQSRQIEALTAQLYLARSPEQQAYFRENRRRKWRAMTDTQRHALRGVKRPKYSNLTDEQKLPFRQGAFTTLGASGAVNDKALTAALRKEI